MFVVERVLLKRGEIKNNLSIWDRVASVVVERMLLKRGPLKGGSAVSIMSHNLTVYTKCTG